MRFELLNWHQVDFASVVLAGLVAGYVMAIAGLWAGKVPGLKSGFRFATVPEIVDHFGTKPGYLGPIGLKQPVKIVADREVAAMSDWICGANDEGFQWLPEGSRHLTDRASQIRLK